MFDAVGFHPQSESDAIRAVRAKYDPTAEVVPPHLGVVFPTPETVGRENLETHLGTVLAGWQPFTIRLGGLAKSNDHWLFLLLEQGETKMKALYRALYTGLLESHRRDDIDFVPHLGLGLFVTRLASYDWKRPEGSDFDETRYQAARSEAEALQCRPESVDVVHLVGIPDEVLEWARGERAGFSEKTKAVVLGEFPLGARTA